MWTLLLALSLAQEVPAEAGDRALELATGFVERHGPRPANTRPGERAQRWVQQALEDRGWPAQSLSSWPGAVWACQPGHSPHTVLFMAHTDSVPGSPGANDNGSGVGVLLTAAELLRGVDTPRTVCLAFPDAEETGLRGSFALAEASDRGALGPPLDHVISLDMVGLGHLAHIGLGRPWGHRRLDALARAAPGSFPWVYRAVSHAPPKLERSDHFWFTERGIPAHHLYARGQGNVDWAYHSAGDTPDRLQRDTLQQAVEAVVGLALAPPLPGEPPGRPAVVVPVIRRALPGAAVWAGIALGALGWLATLRERWPPLREALAAAVGWWAHGLVATLAFGLAMFLALGFRPMDYALAGPAVCAGWAAWGAVAVGSPREGEAVVDRALGGAVALVLAGACLYGGSPILALPLAIAALGVGLTRWSPLAALLPLWPAAYLVRPDAVRELAFHYLVPAHPLWWTCLSGAVLLPLLAAVRPHPGERRLRVAMVLLVALVACLVGAWLTPEQVAPYVDWSQPTR